MSQTNAYRGTTERRKPAEHMEIVQIISTHKRARGRMIEPGRIEPARRIAPGHKRVEAIVRIKGQGLFTRHIDVPK